MGWNQLSTASLEGVRSDEVLSHNPFCFHQIKIKINQSKEKKKAIRTRRVATTKTTTKNLKRIMVRDGMCGVSIDA